MTYEEIKKRLDELIKDGINTDYVSDCEAIDWIIEQLRASLEREDELLAEVEKLRAELGAYKSAIVPATFHRTSDEWQKLELERDDYREVLEKYAMANEVKGYLHHADLARAVLAKYPKESHE